MLLVYATFNVEVIANKGIQNVPDKWSSLATCIFVIGQIDPRSLMTKEVPVIGFVRYNVHTVY